MATKSKEVDAKIIVQSPEYKAALKEIREKWKLTLETYVHVKDENANQINKTSYDINLDEHDDNNNQKKEGEGKKRKQKNNTGDKPKRKNKKSKKE
mgnify:CR=1 FL=1